LVEILVAGALLVAVSACFSQLLKAAIGYVNTTEANARSLYQARSEMERLRSLPFDSLPSAAQAGTAITPVADDLYLIQSGGLYTLRSRYL